jgi:hypothetical protein
MRNGRFLRLFTEWVLADMQMVGPSRTGLFAEHPTLDQDFDPDQIPNIALVVPSHHAGLPRHK